MQRKLVEFITSHLPSLAFTIVILIFWPEQSYGAKRPAPWDPINPADLAAKDSKVSPGAGAEILFSRSKLEEDDFGLLEENYIRAKIYTRGGIDQSTLLRVVFRDDTDIKELEARVVKVNGSITELTKADFHESIIAKKGRGADLKQIAFAFPNLVPGDIVEYRWKESSHNWVTFWSYCQMEIPVREYNFTMDATNNAVISWQNCPQAVGTGADTETIGVTITNLPPYVVEDYMPPERDCRGWIRLINNYSAEKPEKGWQEHGKYWAGFVDEHTMPNRALTKKARELIAGCQSDDDKLRRLYDFCQVGITNYTWNDSPAILQEKAKHKKDSFQNASQTLERGKGDSSEVDYLFAGLARAAGFEVREASGASREFMLNIRMRNGWDYFDQSSIAVKTGGGWRFFGPGDYFIPFGMISRWAEGTTVLVNDKNSEFVTIPSSPPSLSVIRRSGHFHLDAEGLLEGDVVEERTGDTAIIEKERQFDLSADEIDKNLRASIAKRLPTAEISDIHWENLRARNLPAVLRYKMLVPGFAQQIGQRLVCATNIFKTGSPTLFAAEHRTYPIIFPYAWTEHDDVELQIPEGFELDQPSAPRNAGTPKDPIHSEFSVRYEKKRRTLLYQRNFILGEQGQIAFPVEVYPWIKKTFGALHEAESHTLILKPIAVPAATGKTADPTVAPPVPNQHVSAP